MSARRKRLIRKRSRRRLLVGAGVVVVAIVAVMLLALPGKFDQAIQELTLPLRHEDVIRQQRAKRASTRR